MMVVHHLLGRTPGVLRFAERIAALGVGVHVPDLFDGAIHADLSAGVAHLEAPGMDALIARADEALADLRPGAVLVGLSLGAVAAQRTAQQRGDVRGVVLVGSCLPPDAFAAAWPAATAVGVHAATDDSKFHAEGDAEAADALVAAADDAVLRLHPGAGHLLVEAGHPDHDPAVEASVLADMAELLG